MKTDSLTRFLAVVTTDLLNFMSSRMTATLPLSAAMCAQVIPFYNRETLEWTLAQCNRRSKMSVHASLLKEFGVLYFQRRCTYF